VPDHLAQVQDREIILTEGLEMGPEIRPGNIGGRIPGIVETVINEDIGLTGKNDGNRCGQKQNEPQQKNRQGAAGGVILRCAI